MFFKNVSERIKKLAVILALISFVACLLMVVLFLVATIRTNDAALRVAGIEGMILFAALAVVLPMFSWLVYGFAELVKNSERRAEYQKEIKDMLHTALADGALADELSRKIAAAMPKVVAAEAPAAQGPLAQVRVTAPAPRTPAPAVPVIDETPVATPVAEAAPAPAVPVIDQPSVESTAQIKPLRANQREF